MKNEETAVALCAAGAEKVVSNELKHLGLTVLDTNFGRVRFLATLETLYRALFCLRVADRVLIEAARFPAEDFDVLFENAKNIEWEKYIPAGLGVVVTKVRVNRSKLEAETTIQAMTHKAVATRLCSTYHIERLPEEKTAELRVYIEKNVVSILLDVSGDPLFKRGYRLEGGEAPLRETTAAAILLLSGWRRKFPLYDPFCGAGTIALEAAMFAWDMAPGIGRTFAISDLAIADSQLEKNIRKELIARVDFSRRIRIWGSDSNSAAVEAAKANMMRAQALVQEGGEGIAEGGGGVNPPKKTVTVKVTREAARPVFHKPAAAHASRCAHHAFHAISHHAAATAGNEAKKPVAVRFPHQPQLRVLPMEQAAAPAEEEGFIVTNPPYGNRLGSPIEAETVYRLMNGLLTRFPSWKIAVITSHSGFESHFGRTADIARRITNGALQTYLFVFNNNSTIGPAPRPSIPPDFSKGMEQGHHQWRDGGRPDYDNTPPPFEADGDD